MEYRKLGKSDLKVSRLCFGSLTMGPIQANLPLQQGADLLKRAANLGVNFIDTAEIYQTYPYIRAALDSGIPAVDELQVATKTYAYTREQAAHSLEKARREMNKECIDLFMLHEQESALTLRGHLPALEYFQEAKQEGFIRAIGISCHTIEAVRAALNFSEIEVIHPILNLKGLGIRDGTRQEMVSALEEAHRHGIGIYAMKPLGGGHFQGNVPEALDFLLELPFIDSIAMGMRSEAEIEYAIAYFKGEEIPAGLRSRVGKQKRQLLHLEEECHECGRCIDACPQYALYWKEKPVVKEEECIWCGYCAAACPEFCLRVI